MISNSTLFLQELFIMINLVVNHLKKDPIMKSLIKKYGKFDTDWEVGDIYSNIIREIIMKLFHLTMILFDLKQEHRMQRSAISKGYHRRLLKNE